MHADTQLGNYWSASTVFMHRATVSVSTNALSHRFNMWSSRLYRRPHFMIVAPFRLQNSTHTPGTQRSEYTL